MNSKDETIEVFEPEECERRMAEAMRRMCRQPRQMNLTTGQNLKEPFLSEYELTKRGYPCQCGFE